MPLVKDGRIVSDRYFARRRRCSSCPATARCWCRPRGFSPMPRSAAVARRQDRRDLAEQPRCRRTRAVSRPARRWSHWCFRISATAAPTARRACCASAMAIDGELRATGQVLRDQFVFMLRAGFDAFEVRKEADAEAFGRRSRRYSRVLSADRRRPAHRAAPAHAAASFARARAMSVSRRISRNRRAAVRCRLGAGAATERAAPRLAGRDHRGGAARPSAASGLRVVSSFGTESAALLKMMADVDPAIPVVFLDTGWLFEETLAYRDTLIAAARACATCVRSGRWKKRCRARIPTANCGSPIPTPAAASARSSRWRAR